MREVRTTKDFAQLHGPAAEIEPICGPERFTRRRPMFVHDLSGRELTHNLMEPVILEAARTVLCTYDRPSLRGVETIITRSDHIITRYIHGDQSRIEVYANDGGRYYGSANMGIVKDGERIFIEDQDEVTLSGLHALISPEEAYNYGMWLLQVIPYVDYLQQAGFDGRFLCFAENEWQKRFLEFMGISDRVEVQVNGQAYRIDGPLKAFRQTYRNLALTAREREAMACLTRRADICSAMPVHERVFISRRRRSISAPLYRGLTNEDALIEAMQADGFFVVEPEYLSFAEQVSLFSQADVIVGLGGAGMFNTVFCKPDAKVVSIESSNVWIEAHANLFATAGVDYGIIFGAEDMSYEQEYHRPWSVDVEAVIRILRANL